MELREDKDFLRITAITQHLLIRGGHVERVSLSQKCSARRIFSVHFPKVRKGSIPLLGIRILDYMNTIPPDVNATDLSH